MRYAVLRPFNSPSRRFAVAQIVAADDVDGPVPVDAWKENGFLSPENPDEPVKPLTMQRAPLPPPIELENDDALV